jgi:serine/threonine protein kinase/Tfp pilus assembly protein PilF
VDRIAIAYEAAWKSAKPPQIYDFLGDACGAPRAALVEELLRIDRAYREQFGENQGSHASTPRVNREPAGTYATARCLDTGPLARAAPDPHRDPHASRQLSHEKTLWASDGSDGLQDAASGQSLLRAEIAVPGYEILGKVAHGAMGVVYKARHLQLKRLAALKVIREGAHASADQLARFRREAGAAARLQHPNIVQVYEIGEFGGLPYFAQEFMDGGSLGQRLRASLLPHREAAQLVATLAQAMQTAHQAGIIHRDLKPDNVLLNSSGICKITDFGLAKQMDDDSSKTQSYAVIGTPNYMAPEQASGRTREIGPLSDVYALGAILYACLTSRPPFNAETAVDTLGQVRSEEPVPPRRLQPKVPRDLETICLKCLEKQPCRRYGSAQALADDLQRFINNEPIQARRVRLWERAAKWMRRRPAAAVLVGVLLAVSLALPIAGLQYYDELDRRWQSEQTRLTKARKELRELEARAHTTIDMEDLKKAKQLLKAVREEPSLKPLQEEVWALRAELVGRLSARSIYDQFVQHREEVLSYTWLASGERLETIRTIAQKSAMAALKVIDSPSDRQGDLDLTTWFTDEEKTDITTGSYFLRLMLAEMEARRPTKDSAEEREALRAALKLLERAEQLLPGTRAIHMCRARYLARLGDVRGAAKEQQEIASATVHDLQDHLFVGFEHYSQNELGQAIQEFRQALTIDPEHFWSNFFLGICYVTSHEPNYAFPYFAICQKQRPELSSIYLLRGFASWQLKDYAAAELDFTRALDLVDASRAAKMQYVIYNNRGLVGVLQEGNLPVVGASTAVLLGSPGGGPLLAASALFPGRVKNPSRAKGMEDLKTATNLFRDRHEAWQGLRVAYQLDGHLVEALQMQNKAIEVARIQAQKDDLKPEKLAQLHYSRARLHLQRSGQEATVPKLGQAAILVGDNQPLRSLAGFPLQRLDLEAALLDFKEAARLAESDRSLRAQAQAERGRVLHLRARFEEALAAYDKAQEADPGRVAVYGWRGEVLLAKAVQLEGDDNPFLFQPKYREAIRHMYGEAAAAFDAYLKKGGSPSAAVYRQRGLALSKLDKHPEAILDFSRALEAKPTDKEKARLCLYRGQEYLAIQDRQRALQDFENVLRLDPENRDAYLGRAHSGVKLDPYKAVVDANNAVKGKPKDPRLWLGAARVYALAAAHLKTEPGQATRDVTISNYQRQAEKHLRAAVGLVPSDQQRAFWREFVRKDKALYPIASRLFDLVTRFGGANP